MDKAKSVNLDSKIVVDPQAQYRAGVYTAVALPKDEVLPMLEMLGLVEPLRKARKIKKIQAAAAKANTERAARLGMKSAVGVIPDPLVSPEAAPSPVARLLSRPLMQGRRA